MLDSLRRVGKATGPFGSTYKICKVYNRAQPSRTINPIKKKKEKKTLGYSRATHTVPTVIGTGFKRVGSGVAKRIDGIR